MKWKYLPHANHKDKPTKKIKITKSVLAASFTTSLSLPRLLFFSALWMFSLSLVSSVCVSLGSAGAVLQWQPAAAWRWVVLSCSSTPGRQIQAAGSSNTQADATPPESPGQTQTLQRQRLPFSAPLYLDLSFKARGVSVVHPVLLSFLCSSSAFVSSSTSLEIHSLMLLLHPTAPNPQYSTQLTSHWNYK